MLLCIGRITYEACVKSQRTHNMIDIQVTISPKSTILFSHFLRSNFVMFHKNNSRNESIFWLQLGYQVIQSVDQYDDVIKSKHFPRY